MLQDMLDKVWDIAIVGTGMGGGVLGRRLTELGHEVLFIERGLTHPETPEVDGPITAEEPASRLKFGAWPFRLEGYVDGHPTRFFPYQGCGAGGSTLFYAAALERFDPRDLHPSAAQDRPELVWPVSYDELRPYYRVAERMFRLRGTPDPLGNDQDEVLLDPPALSAIDAEFVRTLQSNGLHPYRLHVGFGYSESCKECSGIICKQSCKADARVDGVLPALASGKAQIIDECEVERLIAEAASVKKIVARRHGTEIHIRARIVVLSAGALSTPAILLRSSSPEWPRGLANSSDQVGRNLMFHISDFIAVWPSRKLSIKGPKKTLAFRDYYYVDGKPYGLVESTGLSAGYGNVVHFLRTSFDKSRWRWFKPVRPFLRIPAYIGSKLFGRAIIFATIQMDWPYPENRVVLDPEAEDGIHFEYKVHPELRERIYTFRTLVRHAFRPLRSLVLGNEVNINYGHACGTCRFGNDPASSVLNRDNRVHEIENLYVVDASFMPTSGGSNPSLTIAANALRVAERIDATMRGELYLGSAS